MGIDKQKIGVENFSKISVSKKVKLQNTPNHQYHLPNYLMDLCSTNNEKERKKLGLMIKQYVCVGGRWVGGCPLMYILMRDKQLKKEQTVPNEAK